MKRTREINRLAWEGTKKLVGHTQLNGTLSELRRKVEESTLKPILKDKLVRSLEYQSSEHRADGPNKGLKELTGLPTTKAIRALCVIFSVGRRETPSESCSTIPPSKIEEILRQSSNPYDLLLNDDFPSLLDLGAGDLTFEQELVDQYLPHLQKKECPFVLHAVDRLQPGSQVGGVYHADSSKKQYLERFPPRELQYQFWGGVNIVDLSSVKQLQHHYTIVTCHAPANPTFAFEPSRLTQATLWRHLAKNRGEFRKRKVGGEEILEVYHEGRVLTFPDWKFEILGPLALLNIMIRRGGLCLLTAMDGEVFWEVLSQLLKHERYRPKELVFTPGNLKEVFGAVYSELMRAPIGYRIPLSDLAEIRTPFPQSTETQSSENQTYGLRYVEIRRGATFEGVPSSFTSRQFVNMREEDPPWWVILVPEVVKS